MSVTYTFFGGPIEYYNGAQEFLVGVKRVPDIASAIVSAIEKRAAKLTGQAEVFLYDMCLRLLRCSSYSNRGGETECHEVPALEQARILVNSSSKRVPGLESKLSSDIYAGITRWIDAGLVKRRDRGVYQRIRGAAASKDAGRRREEKPRRRRRKGRRG